MVGRCQSRSGVAPIFSKTRAPFRVVELNRSIATLGPTLACYPNPNNAATYLTYPAGFDGSAMVILEAKGSLVCTLTLQASGLLELDTKQLPAGMYQIAIPGTAFSTKLSVQH